jgi:putative drug exporter of the RND superfamily
MSHALYRLGRAAARKPWRVIGLWLILATAVVATSGIAGRALDDSIAVPGLDSQQATELLTRAGADDAGLTAYVVATPRRTESSLFDDANARDELAGLHRRLAALPNVLDVTDPGTALAAGRDAAIGSGSVSADGRVALLRLQYPVREALSVEDLNRLEAAVADARAGSALSIELGGDLSFAFAQPETGTSELVGLIAAVLILLVAFGSFTAMGLPIGMAVVGLTVSVSSMSLLMYLVDIPSWSTQIGVMIGLGVGIDYALFLVTRHRELLAGGLPVDEAVGRAVATAGQAVVFAGGTVVIAILGLAVAGIPFVTNGGIAISVIVASMVLASITLLPALLGLVGHRIGRQWLRFGPARRAAAAGDGAVSLRWQRFGRHVSAHAGPYAVGVVGLLLLLSAPVLSLRLGFPDDGTLPQSRTERRAYDLVAAGFGPGVNGPVVVAVDLHGDAGAASRVANAVAGDRGIASVAPPQLDPVAGVATIAAIPTTAPQDAATLETIERLRAEVLPAALGDSAARAHVGGSTATWGDLGSRVKERLPLFIAAVVLLSFVLLTIVFRSVLVPLKAALLNLLSIGAAYGVMVAVFQWGWGKDLIGLEGPVPIIPFIPMFMFAILFGLSMDYEVFLLSRVREEYVATGDNQRAVIHGIASTARVITSAAIIMISVFVAFALGDDPSIKMFGIGLAVAVLVDATVVRLLLVPASMKLLGDANWWLPAWLDRILPTVDIEGPQPDRSTRPEPETAASGNDRLVRGSTEGPIPDASVEEPHPSAAGAQLQPTDAAG